MTRWQYYSSSPSYSAQEWKMDPFGKWRYVGRGGTKGLRIWQCKGCGSSNHTRNACSTCGMWRSWAEVVKSGQEHPKTEAHGQVAGVQPSQNKINVQLAQ
eukprot:5862250-Karenia_brevis.AAC.1